MKQFFCFLFLISCCVTPFCLTAHGNQTGGLKWVTNYEQAVNQSQTTSKPIVLFFTGSDWCGWCNKLEEEALDQPEFVNLAGDKFIFVKLDFPLYSAQDATITAQNKALQKKFDIRSFPTLIVLDSEQQKQIGVTGYRPGGAKEYAGHLFKMVSDYSAYKQKMQGLEKQKLSGNDLRKMYEKAKELGFDNEANRIVKAGMNSDQEHYFLLERYRFFAEEGQLNDKQAAAVKARLNSLDPKNQLQTQYQIAVIEFEANCEEMNADNLACEKVVEPLIAYIHKFGSSDKDNIWRLHMIISQVFLDKNQLPEALEHAKASYASAPSGVQPEIATAIKNIQAQLNTKKS